MIPGGRGAAESALVQGGSWLDEPSHRVWLGRRLADVLTFALR